MDFIDRLKAFMDYLGMPSSVFADTAKIPRPTLSQIINGRNKKISNELISKLHLAFPQLNVLWLMFGDGDMVVGENIQFSEPKNQPISAESQTNSTDNEDIAPRLDFDFDASKNNANRNSTQDAPENEAALSSILANRRSDNKATVTKQGEVAFTASAQSQGKRIESIMVFYTDNSFEVFRPSEYHK